MGKYTKMALVLLYLLQLVVVFREQLAHLYETAVHAVHSTERVLGPHEGFKAALKRVVTMTRPVPHEAIVAALPVAAVLHGTHEDGDHEHPPHNEDDKKDKAKRMKHGRPGEYLIANLWRRMRRHSAAPASVGAKAGSIVRALMAASIPAPAKTA